MIAYHFIVQVSWYNTSTRLREEPLKKVRITRMRTYEKGFNLDNYDAYDYMRTDYHMNDFLQSSALVRDAFAEIVYEANSEYNNWHY